ncbi:type II toxin-antitoxin system mRNA interferase toxin, RelE/StbE family [Peptoniphilus sp. DNF00840]|nr:toxin-antitoxin system, toxin component, RelE domain protein [Peptoniphilus sp. DNF00840]
MFEIIEKIAKDEAHDKRYRDHSLVGNYKGIRECHIESDFLLIYEK